jgi:hypothetical protein
VALAEEISDFRESVCVLLDSPAPSHAAIEDTLTTGYAHALGLEAARRRLEHSIIESAAVISAREPESVSRVRSLASELEQTEGLLNELREAIEQLRGHLTR